MCEDSEPVRALTFLQTQVSAVVDHTNPEETNVFRSLLTHLLVPATRSTPKASLPYPTRTGDSSVTPARKRSRPDTPTESEEQDEVMADETTGKKADTLLVMEGLTLFKPDLIEYKHSPDKVKVSEARFRQRTEVFEELMKFVNEDVKQPERDLFSLINIDQEET